MQLKNNSEGNIQLFYPVTKNGKPDVDFVHIPGKATVELDDAVFEALCKPLTTISVQREEETEIEGEAKIQLDRKPVVIKEYYETGETRVVNLVKEAIKSGDLIVVEAPEVSKEKMAAVLNQNGVSAKDLDEATLKSLYLKLV